MKDAHHAYLYVGNDTSVLPAAVQQASIDVDHWVTSQWGIGDSRALAAAAAQRPVAADKRVFVVVAHMITPEAQNALLKLFEDPPPTAVFYLVVPAAEQLLATVRSRLQTGAAVPTNAIDPTWEALRQLPLAEQLKEVANRAKAKDTDWQRAVLQGAVRDPHVPAVVRLRVERFRQLSGASRKMLIEEVVLTLASSK